MVDQVRFDLQDAALLKAIDRVLGTLQRPHDLLTAIGDKLESNAQLRFDTKTDPTNKPWAPLRPATQAIYASEWFHKDNPDFKDGIPGSLLERTRQLRNSLAFNAGPDYLDIGTSRATKGGRWQVGALLETGTRKMEARRILTADPATGTLGADDTADVLAIVSRFMGQAFA